MRILIIITTNESEKVWNAFRLANSSLAYENQVHVFLLGSGVEAATIDTKEFNVIEQMDIFHTNGGTLLGCGICCEKRKEDIPFLLEILKCEVGSMNSLYELVANADKVLTF